MLCVFVEVVEVVDFVVTADTPGCIYICTGERFTCSFGTFDADRCIQVLFARLTVEAVVVYSCC